MQYTYPFYLVPLPYSYDSLEPYIDAETMKLHHDKHLKTYVDNLNNTLAPFPQLHKYDLETLLKNIPSLPSEIQTPVRNNGGGVFNHNLYFSILSNTNSAPSALLEQNISKNYGNLDNFLKELKEEALKVFGSGYAFVVVDRFGDIKIIKTKNQDSVLELNLYPILLVDVWEHAYYLKYNNRRNEYLDNFMKIINWNIVNANYVKAMECLNIRYI